MRVTTIKNDLVEKVSRDKYYHEQNLLRLVKNDSMEYNELIESIDCLLENIALANTKIELIKEYFQPISKEDKKQEHGG